MSNFLILHSLLMYWQRLNFIFFIDLCETEGHTKNISSQSKNQNSQFIDVEFNYESRRKTFIIGREMAKLKP